jgi:hypothetical protein
MLIKLVGKGQITGKIQNGDANWLLLLLSASFLQERDELYLDLDAGETILRKGRESKPIAENLKYL